jgi:hypothetical protein
MTTDPQRIKRLEVASAFCLFDKKLRSSGNGSIVWGVLNLAIGGALLTANDRWGAVSVVLGLALVAAGIYERPASMKGPFATRRSLFSRH